MATDIAPQPDVGFWGQSGHRPTGTLSTSIYEERSYFIGENGAGK
jgi:hypothetical protein